MMFSLFQATLLVLHVNVARVVGPSSMSEPNIQRVLRAVRRQYRKQAKIVIFYEDFGTVGSQSNLREVSLVELQRLFSEYRDAHSPTISKKGRAALLFAPPLSDGSAQYAGGVATLRCARSSATFGLVAIGDTDRQWELAPTTAGHELGHQLSASHTSSGMMALGALADVKGPKLRDRPAIAKESVRAMRYCLKGSEAR